MILSKYESDADVYQYYQIKGNKVTYEKRYLQSQDPTPVRKWTLTLKELGWTSVDNYIQSLNKRGFKEVKHERMENLEAAAV